MTASAHNPPDSLDLTREEAWVVHAALTTTIDRILDDEQDPSDVATLLRAVEADETFESEELEHLVDVLRTYAEDAPARDEELARDVIDDIEAVLA